MNKPLKACLSIFRIQAVQSLQYRMAALSNASISVFWGLIEITVYIVFFTYGSNSFESINGLNLVKLVSYTWMAQALLGLQAMNIDGELREKITNGNVGVELCRPLDLYLHWYVKTASAKLGDVMWRALFTITAGLLMPAVYRLSGPESLTGFLTFLCSALSAFILGNAYGMLVTAMRLGITWGEGPTYILLLIGNVLSGGYLPLQLWPDFMQKFLLLQPFAGGLDIPLRLYVGTMEPSQGCWAVLLQLGWAAVFVLAGRMIMSRRIKGVIVQGG